MQIPFQDFKSAYVELREELDSAYQKFMQSSRYVLGEEVAGFESEYAKFCEAAHCVGVGNGLDALHLALLSLDVGTSDEVIVPSNTYIATWLAVTHAGATPVPVEPDVASFNLDPNRIRDAITSRTKVILAVNLYGQPCDYDAIIEIGNEFEIKVVIDNAQGHGARYKGMRVGGIADVECHSFYPSKNLGAFGEAGCITTNDSGIADRIRVLRNYGSRTRYHNEVIGYNSRLDEIQAAFLRVKLRYLERWNECRRTIARRYICGLGDISDQLILPLTSELTDSVWHLFVVRYSQRDMLQSRLAERGIGTLVHYPIPPHLSGAYANMHLETNKFPIANNFANSVISLPIGPHLTEAQVEKIIYSVRVAVEEQPRRVP